MKKRKGFTLIEVIATSSLVLMFGLILVYIPLYMTKEYREYQYTSDILNTITTVQSAIQTDLNTGGNIINVTSNTFESNGNIYNITSDGITRTGSSNLKLTKFESILTEENNMIVINIITKNENYTLKFNKFSTSFDVNVETYPVIIP